MGLFDSVYVACPHCGEQNEMQSKAALYPRCNNYTLDTAPPEILVDLGVSGPNHCENCGGLFRVNVTCEYKVQPA